MIAGYEGRDNEADGVAPGSRAPMSLQNRIVAVAMITTVAVLLAACAVFTLEQWRAERLVQRRHVAEAARNVAQSLGPAIRAHDGPAAERALGPLAAVPAIEAAVLQDPAGRRLASFQRGEAAPLTIRRATVTTVAVLSRQRLVGRLVIRAAPQSLAPILPRYLAVSGGLFFAATGLALFLGRGLAKRVTEPVTRLSEAMREVARSGDFSRPMQRLPDSELGRLTDAFNDLLGRLDANDRALRQSMADLIFARDAAEAANIQKSEFLANMSHEIRTPLNGVLAMAQLMAMTELSREQQEQVSVIRQSGENLLTVLNDVLDVSKIEAGKLDLETVDFDLEVLVRGIQAAFAPLAQAKGLALSLLIDDSGQGSRRGDAGRLRQIINNLLSNAVKFTAEGAVQVEVRGEGAEGADGLRVLVRDTGIGVSPDKLPLLFRKFSQVDSSTTRQYGGTGLGLAICNDLARLMGGRVWAESEPGVGSTFHLVLPFPRVAPVGLPEPVAAPEDLPDEQGRVLRVLAAEDNPTNQLVLSTIMGVFGADLQMVGDGAAAVEAWRREDFDVILMDIQMPGMDGVEAARAIRRIEASERRPRTPIVALSANAMVHQVETYMAAGMDGHVAKPIELAKLHAALDRALEIREDARAAA